MQSRIDSTIFWNRIRDSVKAEVQEWKKHPELSKIANNLKPGSDPNRFRDYFAEYAIARRFVQIGCEIAVEVANPSGKRADLKAWKASDCMYAHVKHLNPDENHARQELFEIRFEEALKKIKRPATVWLHLRPDLTNAQGDDCIKQAKAFAERVTTGTEEAIFDSHDVNLGTAELQGEHDGDSVRAWIDFGVQECRDRERIPAKFREARDQLMPGATNVIFLACNRFTDHDYVDFENSLLGSTCGVAVFDETMEPKCIPTGRKSDGFWSGSEHPDCQAACCYRFYLTTGEIEPKTWIRGGRENELPSWFRDSFHSVTELEPTNAASTNPVAGR